jgi:predicted O-methyltransferase YrrM
VKVFSSRIAPSTQAAMGLHRAVMLTQARRLARREHPRAGAIASALHDAALGRLPAAEREWSERIDWRRAEIPFEMASANLRENDPEASPAERLAQSWHVCRWVSIPPVWGDFLLRLVAELGPSSCLELGTGLGLSGAYEAAALELRSEGRLVTMDFHEAARIGERGFGELGLSGRVALEFGDIDETLPGVLERAAPIDYAMLDAEHTESATVRHFEAVAPHLAGGAIVVLDDITSTEGMRAAWRRVVAHPRVSLAVPLRRIGIVAVSEAPG